MIDSVLPHLQLVPYVPATGEQLEFESGHRQALCPKRTLADTCLSLLGRVHSRHLEEDTRPLNLRYFSSLFLKPTSALPLTREI